MCIRDRLYPAYCKLRRQSPRRKDQARWRDGLHHRLLAADLLDQLELLVERVAAGLDHVEPAIPQRGLDGGRADVRVLSGPDVAGAMLAELEASGIAGRAYVKALEPLLWMEVYAAVADPGALVELLELESPHGP